MNLRSHLGYLRYVLRHKWFVARAGWHLDVPTWRLIVHDVSKFSPAEWNPYRRRFFSGRAGVLDKRQDPDDFHRAWTHHWHANTHHWEHWLRVADGAGPGVLYLEAMPMPDVCIREMVADWFGAGRAITGSWSNVHSWYADNRDRILLTDDDRDRAEELLLAVPLT